MLGRINISCPLDEGCRIGVGKRNKEVNKNRHILSKIIDRVKFCGPFELALRGHGESESSQNPGVFRGLIDFVALLDTVLNEHLVSAAFEGTSKTIQNELLDCMLSVLREYITEKVRSADFVSIQADETMDISTQYQLVLKHTMVQIHERSHRWYTEEGPGCLCKCTLCLLQCSPTEPYHAAGDFRYPKSEQFFL